MGDDVLSRNYFPSRFSRDSEGQMFRTEDERWVLKLIIDIAFEQGIQKGKALERLYWIERSREQPAPQSSEPLGKKAADTEVVETAARPLEGSQEK
jgi:hypothetical protein